MNPGYIIAPLTILVFLSVPVLYVWTKRRAFWRDEEAAADTLTVSVDEVQERFASEFAPDLEAWVYLVREGEQPTGRARTLLAEGWRPGGTTVWGVTPPRLRYEYGLAWLTRLLKGAGPVYEIAVREKPGDPGGARALAHELAHHVWPHLQGLGWNRDHSLSASSEVTSIETQLLEGLQ